MLYLFVLLALVLLAFGVNVVFKLDAAKRPDDVTQGRWVWLTSIETAAEWWARPRGLPAKLRALRAGDGDEPPVKLPRMVAPPRDAPRPPPVPLPPMPSATPRPAPGRSLTPNGVPADWAALAARIADTEPVDDNDWREYLFAEALGISAYVEGWFAHIEILANGLRLDPVVLQAAGFFADMFADMAEGPATLVARLEQAYELPYQHLDEGGTLPDAPDWLTPGAV